MIDSNSILEHMRQESYRPLSYHELKEVLAVSDEDEDKFVKQLGRLEKEGEIVKTRKNKYGLPEKMNLVRGTMRLNQRGYGILVPDDVTCPEVFVYGGGLNGAMHSDKVLVRLSAGHSTGQRPEGEVIRIIKRANHQLVGTYEKGRKKRSRVIPDDNRHYYPVYIKPVRKISVKDGDKVLVNITSWPDRDGTLEGKIVEVLGRKGDPGLDLQIVIKKHGLRTDFPAAVLEEARQVAQPVTEEEINQRRDLRSLTMVTIDGEDAKDLDDAVSIERIPAGYRLGVHIADVSHYVKEGSRLDREAYARGTSVYLVDKVLPMLPPELSNNICSLNAREDRLAISCIMDIDHKGQVINYDISKSVININERMTYTAVNRILADDKEEQEKYKDLCGTFFLMKELADILRARRMRQGSLDFDFPESKVLVDENSFPVEIKLLERGPGEMLIEDFMIKANEVVAEHMYWQQIPILYRVHEKPDEESLAKLNMVLGGFGHKITARKIESFVFQNILEKIKGKPEEQMISMVMLRSMKHARYAPEALGHFGLASKYYCHFTSPIRRYPDLVVHRALTALLEGKMNNKKRSSWENKMGLVGEHCTLQEIKAEEAERELLDIKKAQYMKQFVGEEFTARISSIVSFGFFVQLDNTVEGLVHISSITDDYYEFNDRNYTLLGRHTGRKFAIGDEVRVQLVRVDVDEAQIDFELIE